MQTLDIISVNIWQIVISLCNLVIIFLIIKHFLFKRVKKMMDKRKEDIDKELADAEGVMQDAIAEKQLWKDKIDGAKAEAKGIIDDAVLKAKDRSDAIVADANEKANSIRRQAETDIALERRKSEEQVKKEIVDVSTLLTEKVLGREINPDDHKSLIDSVIEDIGKE